MRQNIGLILISALIWLIPGCGGEQPASGPAAGDAPTLRRSQAAPGSKVFIISPKNGETVSSPVKVKFGVSGIAVEPAGAVRNNAGHHHLIVDMGLKDLTLPIPTDEHHLHFGKGQTEASVKLPPGQHTLQLVLADGIHIPHNPPVMSSLVVITVK